MLQSLKKRKTEQDTSMLWRQRLMAKQTGRAVPDVGAAVDELAGKRARREKVRPAASDSALFKPSEPQHDVLSLSTQSAQVRAAKHVTFPEKAGAAAEARKKRRKHHKQAMPVVRVPQSLVRVGCTLTAC